MFHSLKEKSVVYLLKNEFVPVLLPAEVVSVKFPQQLQYGNLSSEMNIVVKAEGSVVNLEGVPCYENLFTSKDGSLTVCDSKEVMAAHIDAEYTKCRNTIESYDYSVSAAQAYEGMQKILNPQLAREQERDVEIKQLNRRMDGLEQNLTGIQAGINELLKAWQPNNG
ncbi:MAG: hypothetical protein J6C66_06105 [Prevotella sp.]|nr:hypothetical protein [Prevotella sp.]